MTTAFHTQSGLTGYEFEDAQLTCVLATTIVATDVGKAVTQDATGSNKVKLAGDGDVILGYLKTFENRVVEGQKVGTVAFRFAKKLPIKAGLTGGEAVAVGSLLVGAGNGEVKALDLATIITGTHSAAAITSAIKAAADAPRVWAVSGLVADATKI